MDEISLIAYFSSLFLGAAGACAIRTWGNRFSLQDLPNARSSHNTVVPKGGGIGILASFLICSFVLCFQKSFWIPATLVSLFSLWGDRTEIRARFRLLVQFGASIILLVGIFWRSQSPISSYLLISPLAIFIVGTANYYNFMDGINGIAGIAAVVGFALLGYFAMLTGAEPQITTLCICLCLASIGFLPLNMPKAKVFMGDVGSILLGFVFAGLVPKLSKNITDFLVTAAFLFPFYADELTTTLERVKDGEKLTRPHRRHLYQLLANEIGIDHWKVSVGYGILQLVVGLSVFAAKSYGIWVVLLLLSSYFIGFALVSYAVRVKM